MVEIHEGGIVVMLAEVVAVVVVVVVEVVVIVEVVAAEVAPTLPIAAGLDQVKLNMDNSASLSAHPYPFANTSPWAERKLYVLRTCRLSRGNSVTKASEGSAAPIKSTS
jgi:hypothetical protein